MTWFSETLHLPLGFAQQYLVGREIHRETTPFQDMIIFENPTFGRVLVLDGIIQTTERDEFVYHEMMAHVPLFAHGMAKRVLIIGGGDGGVLREVLRHPVDVAVMVEIDGAVIERCRTLMPSLSAGAFDDPRADVRIDDGIRYVAEATDPFDAIIVDSTDPVGPGEVLFTPEFYANCRRLLGTSGVMVNQCGVPMLQGPEVTDVRARLAPLFDDVSFYLAATASYVGGFMTISWATANPQLRAVSEGVLAERYAAADLSTRYYAPDVHKAAFALPPFIRSLMAGH